MRSGELRGLAWDAVGDGWVEVRAQLLRLDGEWVTAPPKVERAVVRIAIDPGTAAALEAHRRRMAGERQPDWPWFGLVFVTEAGMPYHPKTLLTAFAAACKRAGLGPRRIHDLRHTNLRLLHDIGTPEDIRMARAGHESKDTQRGYSGASAAQDRVFADSLGRVLTG
jgi:integrase